ncbi:MAG: tetratricopeptide repeat protein [Bacteroidota bacterium]
MRNKSRLLLFLFIAVINTSFATVESDSLKQKLAYSIGNDKMQLLQKLCREYIFSSTDSCIKYGTEVIALAQNLNDIENEALANKRIGYALLRTSDYNRSLIYFERALYLFVEMQDYLDAAVINNFIGSAYYQKSDYSKAISYYIETEKSCDTLINNDSTQTSVKRLYAILYTNLGLLYHNLDSIQKPLSYFNMALRYAEDINDLTRISASYSNLGMMYKATEEYEPALENYLKSLTISRKIGNRNYELATLNNIASLYSKIGLNDSALIYYNKSIDIAISTDDKYGLSLINRNISEIYLIQRNYKHAFENADIALEYSKAIGSLEEVYSSYNLLSRIYKELGDYENAYHYYEQYAILMDSVKSIETMSKVAEIQTKYETEKKEKENSLLKKDIKFEKGKSFYLMLLAILLILIVIIGITLFYFIRKNTITKRKLTKAETARMEAELESQKRELTLGALSVSRNLEFINSLINELKELTDNVNEDGLQSLNNIVKKLTQQQTDSSWNEFEKRFSEIHSVFYLSLLKQYPNLSQNEVKLSAFLKLGMNTKEICAITFQSVRAVEAARLRLRKKLNLSVGDNLCMFLQKL